MVKTFKGTVHTFKLRGQMREVVDPRTIPLDIRDALCRQHDYALPSIIGPNHDVAYFDLMRQNWRDMRYAEKVSTCYEQSITYDTVNGRVVWA